MTHQQKAESIGRCNASEAFAMRDEYDSMEHAAGSYSDNVSDTLVEMGLTEYAREAYHAFNDEWDRLTTSHNNG